MDDYEKYEQECECIRTENSKLLDKFSLFLEKSNLSKNTIKKHVNNVDFYINEFLLCEEATEAKDGSGAIGMFLGFWFIKKAMWSSAPQIKSHASSLKKFYSFMLENDYIKKEQLEFLSQMIKDEMPEWIATVKRYDDPNITKSSEVWGSPDFSDFD